MDKVSNQIIAVKPEEVLPLDLNSRLDHHVAAASAIAIVDQATYDDAAERIKGLKALEKEIDSTFTPMKKASHDAWKNICRVQKEKIAPIDSAIVIVRDKILAFDAAQQRAQAEVEARRRKVAETAERKRIALEAREAAKAGASAAEVRSIKAQPAQVGDIAAPPTYQSSSGISTRKVWTYRVDDKMLLIRAVANNLIGSHLIRVDEKALRAFITSSRGTQPVPGVRIFCEHALSVRTA